MEVFNGINLKHFNFLRYISENINDDHVMCKISCIIRSDRIDTPYYMDVHFALTFCTDTPDNGIIHAMDILKNQRMYNINKEVHDELVALFRESFSNTSDDDNITLRIEDKLNQVTIQTKTPEELINYLNKHSTFFDRVDSLS